VAAQVSQESAKKVGHVKGLEIILLKANVQTHVLALHRNAERRQRRDFVVLIAVANDGRLALTSPGATPRGNEQKAAFIEENEVGTKFSGFFLYLATCSASNVRLLSRRAGSHGARAPGNSSPRGVVFSRRGRGEGECRIRA